MKRTLVLILALNLLLLCACDGKKVPAYEAPSTQAPSSTEPTEPVSISTDLSYVSAGEPMLRLTRYYHYGERCISAFGKLQSYDPQLDKWQDLCDKENCPHADENCNAWLGLDVNGLYFAEKGNTLYCIYGTTNDYGNLTDLEFFTLDLATWERRSYHKATAPKDGQIILCDGAVYGSKAVLSYDVIEELDTAYSQNKKEHFILVFDLESGDMTTLMENTLSMGELYDLWGMSDGHILLAFHHSNSEITSYGRAENAENYNDYTMRLHRWVILEYPMEENARWSNQVAESTAGYDLRLFSYDSFYGGALYYVLNDSVWRYDLQSHRNKMLFEQKGITGLSCFDGRIFFTTENGEYCACNLSGGEPVQLPQEEGRIFFITEENEDYFYGDRTVIGGTPAGTRYMIAKEDFYKGSIHSLAFLNP